MTLRKRILLLLLVASAGVVLSAAAVHISTSRVTRSSIHEAHSRGIAAIKQRISEEFDDREKQLVVELTELKAERVREVMQKMETALELVVFSFENVLAAPRGRAPPLVEYWQFDRSPWLLKTLVQPQKYRVKVLLEYSDVILMDSTKRYSYSVLYWNLNNIFKELYQLYPHILGSSRKSVGKLTDQKSKNALMMRISRHFARTGFIGTMPSILRFEQDACTVPS